MLDIAYNSGSRGDGSASPAEATNNEEARTLHENTRRRLPERKENTVRWQSEEQANPLLAATSQRCLSRSYSF
jgi:hypothetical protein